MPTESVSIETSETVSVPRRDLLHFIKRYPLFAVLPPATQERLADLLELERHPVQHMIFRYNDPGDSMYFLCEGSVRFVTRDYTGREVELEEIQKGDLFGEVALYTGGERTAAAVATSATVLLLLRREKMNDFLRSCPEVSEYLLKRMASRLSSSNRLLRSANVQVDDVVASERSVFDRIVKKIVDIFGTLPSFVIHIFIILLWIALREMFNAPFMQFEDKNLLILSLIINVEGFAVSLLILVNQARESKEESVRDRTEFEATLHTDNSIRYLHEKVDELAAELHRFHIEQTAASNGSGYPAASENGRTS